jgi:hypothetical protein
MPLYDPTLVDQSTKEALLRILPHYIARFTLDLLENVWWKLLTNYYPLDETYHWLSEEKSAPLDVYERQKVYFDPRNVIQMFWQIFYTDPVLAGAPARPRLSDGSRMPPEEVNATILSLLTGFPFVVAINTWIAVSAEWLQICNVDWYYERAKKEGQAIPSDQITAAYLAGRIDYYYR